MQYSVDDDGSYNRRWREKKRVSWDAIVLCYIRTTKKVVGKVVSESMDGRSYFSPYTSPFLVPFDSHYFPALLLRLLLSSSLASDWLEPVL